MRPHPLLAEARQHHLVGQLALAEQLYRRIRADEPNNPDALHLLGTLALAARLPDVAAGMIRQAISVDPSVPEYHKDLALALRAMERFDDAIRALHRAIELRPGYAEPYFHLGNLLQAQARLDEAIAAFGKLLELEPNVAEGHVNLGNALLLKNDLAGADAAYRRALELNPDLPRAHLNRALLLLRQDRIDDAAGSSRRAIQLAPQIAEGHNNLGSILLRQGLIDDAIGELRTATTLAPAYHQAHSNYLFALHYHPRFTPERILAAHREWAQQWADPMTARARPHDNDRNPQRRLRIAYISPDLPDHPVGRFTVPQIENHDRNGFEVHVFCDVHAPDDITRRLMRHTDHWHQTWNLPNHIVVERISAAGIDIVIDLALHSAGNRLMALAEKPAPVQVTYLAYPGTSGMSAMDYRITDPLLDPPGQDASYSEESLRLDHYWCYNPPEDSPDVGALPARRNGHITFGCLNAPTKLSEPSVVLFSDLLEAIPNSRLLLHADPGSQVQRIRNMFAASNHVDPDRIVFVPLLRRVEYFGMYNQIDVALDPFPFVGGATTCDALWMGVPVITLAGQIATRRFGASFLTTLGLPELIAVSHAQYIQIAAALAGNLDQLETVRASLREKMRSSPLLDCPGFTRNFESVLRHAWRSWCERRA